MNVFTRDSYRQVIMDSLDYCQKNKGLHICGFVMMSNHLHLIVFDHHAKYNTRNRKYQFWQQHNHPIELVSPKWIHQKINYLHLNPVRNNLVAKAEDYRYSSTSSYVYGTGVLEVEIIDLGLGIGYVNVG